MPSNRPEHTRLTGQHIVILGGGFAGWYAARALAPRLRSGNRITLVDRVDHMLYTPMLTEVAGGNLDPATIAVPSTNLPRRVRFVQAEVQVVNISAKSVTLAGGEILRATQLVFALGATSSYHNVPGAREHTLPLKTLADATRILSRLDDLVKQAAACTDSTLRKSLLTVVVAGGGYTGVETMAAVAEHLRRRASLHGLSPADVSAVLIEPTDRLMHETAQTLAAYSQRHLERNGVRVILNVGVERVTDTGVHLTDGEEIKAGLTLWDTGIEPSPILKQIALPLSKHGAVIVDACFQVLGLRDVWAIGDCAEIPQGGGGTYARTAQTATREGVHLAQNISATLRGDLPRPFRFKMLGQLALLSHRRAVAEILGVRIRGALAWAMWWAIYIAKLPYMRGRVGALRELIGGSKSSNPAPRRRTDIAYP